MTFSCSRACPCEANVGVLTKGCLESKMSAANGLTDKAKPHESCLKRL